MDQPNLPQLPIMELEITPPAFQWQDIPPGATPRDLAEAGEARQLNAAQNLMAFEEAELTYYPRRYRRGRRPL